MPASAVPNSRPMTPRPPPLPPDPATTTPRLHGPLGGSAALLDGVRANDAVPNPDDYLFPDAAAQGKKARSLMQPQEIAKNLLPGKLYEQIYQLATGCKADCGDPWTPAKIDAARRAGPHVTARAGDSIELVWEDVTYQRDAGFIKILSESELFNGAVHPDLKISRVAVVPQANRRGRIILNLSAEVNLQDVDPTERKRRNKGRRTNKHKLPSVNETTVPADDQAGVEALGTAMTSIMQFMFDTDPDHEIDWNKIDLSDGFWRMIVEDGKEWNFVYQLPRRPEDTEDHYVVPSSLQMGWKNSPALFCTATEATRTLIQRILALTMKVGIVTPHRHEKYLFEFEKNPTGEFEEDVADHAHADDEVDLPWATPYGVTLLSRVFVDDFMNGIAGPRKRPTARRRQEQMWFGRATLHGIHGIFPPPDVLHHHGGRDSVSMRKCEKGDAIWKQYEILLGFGVNGAHGPGRTVGLPEDKKDKYVAGIRDALDKPRNFMLFGDFQKLHGRLQHASSIMPSMRGHMSPLNRVLAAKPERVGLKKSSELRETLEAFIPLLEASHTHPSHITELVGPDLPHYHGYVDAAGGGVGGVWLPCTSWLNPVVWRFQWPPDIAAEVRKANGWCNNNDVEAGATFIAQCMMEDDILQGNAAGVSTHLGSDNTATVSWETRGASRGSHRAPDRLQRWKSLRQRYTRRGPADVDHVAGKSNRMADIPSRSFDDAENNPCPQFLDHQDTEFLAWFSNAFPLDFYPTLPSQNVSWQLRRPSAALISAVCSVLRGQNDTTIHPATSTGVAGAPLPITLATTLSSLDSKECTSIWNEQTCSWPLLLPSGEENTSEVVSRLRRRQSR